MPTVVQFRRGTTAQNNSFTGASGELSVDTQLGTIRVHNGVAGGNTLASIDAVQTLSNKTLSAPNITGTLTSTGHINTSGNITAAAAIFNSLIVNGTTTTINSTTLDVADLNITVAKGAASAAAANGAGLTADGASATLLYTSTTDSWNVNKTFISNSSINTSANVSAAIGSFDSITVRAAVTAIANGGTSGVGNIGASGATFNTVWAKATTAQYADLAEIYTSDQQYPSGTVLIFDGESEVTQSHSPHDTRIAGVVSTNPAYLMNHNEVGVPVALQGRVPCRVLGPVSKGDRIVSSHIAGVAQALDPQQYQPGCIIGKALQAIDSTDILIIEVVVGRL